MNWQRGSYLSSPISNLHRISKIVERLVLSRISSHVEQSPCFNTFQSAYRRGYSTETTLLELTNDVYVAADNKARTLIIQLDFSAAFDTMDTTVWLQRLEKSFDFTGPILQLIQSYTSGRSQFVRFGGCLSKTTTCKYGVP